MIDFTNVWTIAHKEIRDAGRNRWFLLYAIVFAVLSLALAWLGLAGVGRYGLAGFGRTGASMINLVLLIIPLMGLTVGSLNIASERERGSLLYLMAQPVTAVEVLLGKYLGLGSALFTAIVFGFGLSGLLIARTGGATEVSAYIWLVLFSFLLALVSLSLGFLISSAVRSSATAIGFALFLWLGMVFLGDLGLMGTALVLKIKVGTLLTASFFNPLQIFKMAAIYNLENSLEVLGPAGIYAIRTYGSGLLPMLFAGLFAWILVPLAGTHLIFKKRGVL